MEFKSNVNPDCCTPTGKYELCGCAGGVPHVQLTVVGGGVVQTAWLNTETGETFTTKPVGFVTGTCQESAVNDVLKFSATPPTSSAPFSVPKDGDTTFQTSDGTETGNVIGVFMYEADTGTWAPIPLGVQSAEVGDTLPTGNVIGTVTIDGVAVPINETITTLDSVTMTAGSLDVTYTNETGTPTTQSVSLLSTDASNTLVAGTDGGLFVPPVAAAPIHVRETVTATAGQTSVTLTDTPIGTVLVTRNGVDISDSWTWAGNVGTYDPALNLNSIIDAGDILRFHFETAA